MSEPLKYGAWQWEEALHPRGEHGKWVVKGDEIIEEFPAETADDSVDILAWLKQHVHKPAFLKRAKAYIEQFLDADDDTMKLDDDDVVKEDDSIKEEDVVKDDVMIPQQRPGRPLRYMMGKTPYHWDEAKHRRGGPVNKGRFAKMEERADEDFDVSEEHQGLGSPLSTHGKLAEVLAGSGEHDIPALLDELLSMPEDELNKLNPNSIQEAQDLTGLFKKISQPDGGFTYKPDTHEQPTSGYVVSTYPERSKGYDLKDLKLVDLASYIVHNQDLLSQHDHYFGAWHDPESGKVFLDTVTVVNDPTTAYELAKENDQIAYHDLSTGKSVVVNPNATSGGQVNGGQAGAQAGERPEAGGHSQNVHSANRASSVGQGAGGSAAGIADKRKTPGYLDTPEGKSDFNKAVRDLLGGKPKGKTHATEAGKQQEGRQPEHQNGDGSRKTAKAGGGHRALEGGQEQQEEVGPHAKQNKDRIKAARERADAYLNARHTTKEITAAPPPKVTVETDTVRPETKAGRALEQILADDGLDRLERLKMARREMDRQIRNERAEQRRQPIVVNIQMPEIKMPEIVIPAMPEVKIPPIVIPPAPPVIIPKQDAPKVTVNAPPVTVNVPPPAPPQEYDIKPVRDEDGNVLTYRRIPR